MQSHPLNTLCNYSTLPHFSPSASSFLRYSSLLSVLSLCSWLSFFFLYFFFFGPFLFLFYLKSSYISRLKTIFVDPKTIFVDPKTWFARQTKLAPKQIWESKPYLCLSEIFFNYFNSGFCKTKRFHIYNFSFR